MTPHWLNFKNFLTTIPVCSDCLEHKDRCQCPADPKPHWHVISPQPACSVCGIWDIDTRRRGRVRVKRAYPVPGGDIILVGHYSRPAVYWR